MKKQLLLLVLALLCSLSMSAQIQRKFFGQTLGVSTENDVIEYFEGKGIDVTRASLTSVEVEDMKFGGYMWSTVVFDFLEDKLATVFFINDENDIPSAKERWNDLNEKIKEKYKLYYIPNRSSEPSKMYMDNETSVFLRKEVFEEKKEVLSLVYGDIKMLFDRLQKDEDEL